MKDIFGGKVVVFSAVDSAGAADTVSSLGATASAGLAVAVDSAGTVDSAGAVGAVGSVSAAAGTVCSVSSGTSSSSAARGGRVVLRSVIDGCRLSSCSVALGSGGGGSRSALGSAGGGSRSALGSAGGGAVPLRKFKIISKDVRSFLPRGVLARRFGDGEFSGFTVAPGDFLVFYPPCVDFILSSVAPVLSLSEFSALSLRFGDFGGIVSSVKLYINGLCTDNIVIMKE